MNGRHVTSELEDGFVTLVYSDSTMCRKVRFSVYQDWRQFVSAVNSAYATGADVSESTLAIAKIFMNPSNSLEAALNR